MLDLVSTGQRSVDLLRKLGARIGGVERLVGVHRAADVRVCCNLPAGEVDGFKAGANHLHRLVATQRSQRTDGFVLLEQFPKFHRTAARPRMLDRDRPSEFQYIPDAVRPLDPLEPPLGSRYYLTEITHHSSPVLMSRKRTHPRSKSRTEKC